MFYGVLIKKNSLYVLFIELLRIVSARNSSASKSEYL